MRKFRLLRRKNIVGAFIIGLLMVYASSPFVYAATSYKLLGVYGYAQEMSNWCWAACERSILNYLGFSPLPTQTQIVSTVYNPPVNQGVTMNQIAASLVSYGVNATATSSKLSFTSIEGYINNNQPIIADQWGHATVIRGYYYNTSTSVYDVYWIDPWPSNPRYNITSYNTYKSEWIAGTVKDIWV